MIDRYRVRYFEKLFGDETRLEAWRNLEIHYMTARLDLGDPLVTRAMVLEANATPAPTQAAVEARERSLGHDVVAFLAAWTEGMSNPTASQVHYGLTSSDLVDNALFRQVWLAGNRIVSEANDLCQRIQASAYRYRGQRRPGRTHGQLAEVTTWGWRLQAWEHTLGELVEEWDILVSNRLNVLKTPGGVGNMQILGDRVARTVAERQQTVLVPSTQVIPRQRLMVWAGWCLRLISLCEEIAMEIRLSSRSEVREMAEGGADDRVGSSAMPHKRNPIGSERISGLARVARSQFAALAESAGALHNERDISNSSVERIVVPDLAHLTVYILDQTNEILSDLRVDGMQMNRNAARMQGSSGIQAALQRLGMPYMMASEATREWARAGGWNYATVLGKLKDLGTDLDVMAFLDKVNGTPDLSAVERWGHPEG